jgi:signal peptidase II
LDSLTVEDSLRNTIKSYVMLFGVAGLIIALDQWTKYLVRQNLAFGEMWSPWDWLTPIARIVHWQNTGAAFGMLQGYNLIFSGLAILVSLGIIYFFPKVPAKDWPLRVAMCLQFGGAVGNLIDRIMHGQVTDFISVSTFAVFNVADASISVGVAVLLVGIWLMDGWPKRKAAASEPEDGLNTADDRPDNRADIRPDIRPEGEPGE